MRISKLRADCARTTCNTGTVNELSGNRKRLYPKQIYKFESLASVTSLPGTRPLDCLRSIQVAIPADCPRTAATRAVRMDANQYYRATRDVRTEADRYGLRLARRVMYKPMCASCR